VTPSTRLAALAALALAVVGCGGSSDEPDDDPGAFMTRLVYSIGGNRYGEAWASLHPTHQRVASRGEYIACERREPIVGRVSEVAVLSVEDAAVRVAGETQTSAGKAVLLRVSVRVPDLAEPDRVTQTFHTVAVAKKWRWILSATRYDAYRANRCP
jgi:hypothetical protein